MVLRNPTQLQYFRTYRFIVPHSEFWIHDVLDMTPPSLNLSSNVGLNLVESVESKGGFNHIRIVSWSKLDLNFSWFFGLPSGNSM